MAKLYNMFLSNFFSVSWWSGLSCVEYILELSSMYSSTLRYIQTKMWHNVIKLQWWALFLLENVSLCVCILCSSFMLCIFCYLILSLVARYMLQIIATADIGIRSKILFEGYSFPFMAQILNWSYFWMHVVLRFFWGNFCCVDLMLFVSKL